MTTSALIAHLKSLALQPGTTPEQNSACGEAISRLELLEAVEAAVAKHGDAYEALGAAVRDLLKPCLATPFSSPQPPEYAR